MFGIQGLGFGRAAHEGRLQVATSGGKSEPGWTKSGVAKTEDPGNV